MGKAGNRQAEESLGRAKDIWTDAGKLIESEERKA
jgi:hypothetical protein